MSSTTFTGVTLHEIATAYCIEVLHCGGAYVTASNIDDFLQFAHHKGFKELGLTTEEMKQLVIYMQYNLPHLLDLRNEHPDNIWVDKMFGITLHRLSN